MNDKNLVPFNERTESEKREIAKKGGRASGEARRRKKTMSELARQIANAPISQEKTKRQLKELGIDEDLTNNALVTASVFKSAVKGNMQAVDKWEQLVDSGRNDDEVYKLPGEILGKAFVDINRQIKPNMEYIFKGGRGGLKSSYIAFKIIEIIKNNPQINACIIRKVSTTLKDSVYNTIIWAINMLDLDDEFRCTKTPLEIIYKQTGQTIYFRGADKPEKIKSIKPVIGYIGILWYEEADQMNGEEEIRNIEQSVLRGGTDMYTFKSYNPPKSAANWINKYILIPKKNMIVHTSNYKDAPIEWLGQHFFDEAEHLKTVNPEAYEHEYEGIPNGIGGNVFDFIEIREITDAEVAVFDKIYQGVDWGWFPDPYAFLRTYYNAAQEKIYFIDENGGNKLPNETTAKWIKEKGYDDYVIACDSAEPKSVNDYIDMGLPARGAIKGPGSVDYGFKWLQRRTLVIDPNRTPNALKEIKEYQYERDKEDNFISGYPDCNDHYISALRYQYEPLFNRRGNTA